MKKLVSLLMVLILTLSCMAIVACGNGDDDEDNGTGEATQEPTAAESPEDDQTADEGTAEPETPSTVDADDLMGIFGGIDEVECVQYTVVSSGGGMPSMETKMWWQRDGKSRMESEAMGSKATIIVNPEIGKGYNITPSGAIEFDILEYDDEMTSPSEMTEDILGYNLSEIGSETIDGKRTKIIEYVDDEGDTTRMWVWEDKGFPIKWEMTTAEGTMVMEFKDIEFDCASDDMFELPEGVDLITIPDFGDIDPEDFDIEEFEDMFGDMEGFEGLDLEGMMPSEQNCELLSTKIRDIFNEELAGLA